MEKRISSLGHELGEIVRYSSQERGETTISQWDGTVYQPVTHGPRIEIPLKSLTDVICGKSTIINYNGNGKSISPWVEPCIQFVEGRVVKCPLLSETRGENLCQHPDGPIQQYGGIECPKQKGSLRLITTIDK